MKQISKNNTSGFRGVSFEPVAKKWRAYICFNNQKIRLGYFSSPQEASMARRRAEILYKSNQFSIPNYAKSIFPELNQEEIDKLWINAAFCYLFENKNSNESFLGFAIAFIRKKTLSVNLTFNDVQFVKNTDDKDFIDWLEGRETLRAISRTKNLSIQVVSTTFKNYIKFIKDLML